MAENQPVEFHIAVSMKFAEGELSIGFSEPEDRVDYITATKMLLAATTETLEKVGVQVAQVTAVLANMNEQRQAAASETKRIVLASANAPLPVMPGAGASRKAH